MMENKEDYKIYSTVEKQEVEWLWYPYIPYGKLTLLQGDPGDGKSTFMINIASALTRGGLLPDGKKLEQIGNVIYQGAEDNVGDTIKPRLEEAGADCDRVAFIDDADMGLTFIDDRLEKTIRSFQAKLLVLDPLQAFMPSNADMQNASHVRSIMRKLGKVAEKHKCAVVMIGHMTKSSGGKRLYRGLGSIDIAAICRSVLIVLSLMPILSIRRIISALGTSSTDNIILRYSDAFSFLVAFFEHTTASALLSILHFPIH